MTRNAFKVLEFSEHGVGGWLADGGLRNTGPVLESIDPDSPLPNR